MRSFAVSVQSCVSLRSVSRTSAPLWSDRSSARWWRRRTSVCWRPSYGRRTPPTPLSDPRTSKTASTPRSTSLTVWPGQKWCVHIAKATPSITTCSLTWRAKTTRSALWRAKLRSYSSWWTNSSPPTSPARAHVRGGRSVRRPLPGLPQARRPPVLRDLLGRVSPWVREASTGRGARGRMAVWDLCGAQSARRNRLSDRVPEEPAIHPARAHWLRPTSKKILVSQQEDRCVSICNILWIQTAENLVKKKRKMYKAVLKCSLSNCLIIDPCNNNAMQ